MSHFLDGQGFGFSISGNPAELRPQNGLIPVIYQSGQRPVEELVHTLTVNRRPLVVTFILAEHWSDRFDHQIPSSVEAYRPIVEALNAVYLDTVDDDARVENREYGQEYAMKLIQSNNKSENNSLLQSVGDDGLSSIDQHIGQYTRAREECLEALTSCFSSLLSSIINDYVKSGILEKDREYPFIDQRLSSEPSQYESKNVAYQAVEYMLFRELRRDDEPPRPTRRWQTAVSILDEWTSKLEVGDSPFGFQKMSDYTRYADFVSNWMVGVVRAIDQIGQEIAGSKYKNCDVRLVSSLPAIWHLFHPYMMLDYHMGGDISTIGHPYPWVVLSPDKGFYGLEQRGIGDQAESESLLHEMLSQWEDDGCLLYSCSDANLWKIQGGVTTDVRQWADDLISRITKTLERFEDLWHQIDIYEIDCWHCSKFIGTLCLEAGIDPESGTPNQEQLLRSPVARMLDDRLFSERGESVFNTWRKAYPKWFAQQLSTTLERHPLLETG
jgi:hypothetical protein